MLYNLLSLLDICVRSVSVTRRGFENHDIIKRALWQQKQKHKEMNKTKTGHECVYVQSPTNSSAEEVSKITVVVFFVFVEKILD